MSQVPVRACSISGVLGVAALRRMPALLGVVMLACGLRLVAQSSCTNLCLQQVSCPNTSVTALSGTVFAPNGTDPLPNVLVYIPNAPVAPLTPGVQCLQSGQPASGSPLVSTITGVDGRFTLTNVPVGANIPLVIQAGKWRRQFVIPTISACSSTSTPTTGVNQIRFPRNKSEGDIPLVAAVTGSVDALECVLRKVGIDDSEFTNPTANGGTGRIQLYAGSDVSGAIINASTPSEKQLEDSQATLNTYDLVMFACEGYENKPTAAELANVMNYAGAGGRIFATHYSYDWLVNNGSFNTTASWDINQPPPVNQTATVNTTFPKGQQLAQWLQYIGATVVPGSVPIQNIRKDQDGVVAPTQSFLSISNPSESIQFTFNTPVGLPVANQCGRVLFNEYHVEEPPNQNAESLVFPSECTAGSMTPQEKLLEFSLFDLSTFVSPDLPPTVSIGYTNTPTLFTQGDTADTVSIAITNTSTTTATNPSLSVTLSLPSGLSAQALAPVNPATSGWTCNVASLNCIRSTGLNAGVSDPILVTFSVAQNAPTVSESLGTTVSGGGLTASVTANDSFTVRAVPTITWPTPTPIMAGTAVTNTQLDATATYNGTSVPGTFVYTPAAGAVLAPGSQPLAVSFTPTDTTTYAPANGSVTLQVNQATPTINWANPAAITYGTALSGTQLNATATYNSVAVPGSFAYNPAAGAILTAGSQTLNVTFTPTDTTTYTSANGSAVLQVNQATPTLTWATPAAISYGTALGAAQLNASASVPGTFNYLPSTGTLAAGPHTLSVTFSPTDSTDYTVASTTVVLQVNQAVPTITWATPAAITYGAALSAAQLNATASVPGSFSYTPSSGTLTAGSHNLSVLFTPTDGTDYTTATGGVVLQVNQATPSLTWLTPAAISYGTPLSATQLNATASVPGTFNYTPSSGTLTAGAQNLSVVFTPTDTTDYTTANASVVLQVNQTTPTVTWATPAAIPYGTPLSATQLNATASVPGTFGYTPSSGTLTAGPHTLSVTFTPTDTADYKTTTASVILQVNLGVPAISWATPAPITYGTALSAAQLNASAAVPGTFSYTPSSGILSAGAHLLSVTFNPTDSTDYSSNTATVNLTVKQAVPTITWATPAPINSGTPLSATQLNATASVPGTFLYTPAAGAMLPGGTQTLSVTFTPTDTTDYTNQTATVSLLVNAAAITLGVSNGTQTYQTWTNFVIGPTYTGSRVPTGTVTLYDNGVALVTLRLGGNGLAYWTTNPPLNAGVNNLTASYSGDAFFPGGLSGVTTITVLPAPVNFQASCYGAQVYSTTYQCTVNLSSSTTSPPVGSITYSFDGGAPVAVPISGGNAPFTLPVIPSAGSHTLILSYAGSGNYAAAKPINYSFTTQQGQTAVQISPSSYYIAAGSQEKISGTVTTPSSGVPPGSVTVDDNGLAIGTATIGAGGSISFTVTSISQGSHNYSAQYAGSTNYSPAVSGTSSVTAH